MMSCRINISSISIVRIRNLRKALIKFYYVMNTRAISPAKYLNSASNRIFIYLYYLRI